MIVESKDNITTMSNDPKKQETHKHQFSRDVSLGGELWMDGLICAFEFIRGNRKPHHSVTGFKVQSPQTSSVDKSQKPVLGSQPTDGLPQHFIRNGTDEDLEAYDVGTQSQEHHLGCFPPRDRSTGNYWIPIGWSRISQLLQTVQVDAGWASQPHELDDEEDVTVADVAAPYWERPVGPTWWCHVDAAHPSINSWLGNAQWLHPAISTALLDESRLISERMKHLLYEVIFCCGPFTMCSN